MNPSIENLNRLHDLARQQSAVLRQEAGHNFWRGVNNLLTTSADQIKRRARLVTGRPARGDIIDTPATGV